MAACVYNTYIVSVYLLVRVQEEAQELVVLRLFGVGLGVSVGHSGTGRWLPLDLQVGFVGGLLSGAGGFIGAGVLEQPMQYLVPLRQSAVRGGALRGGSGVGVRC